MIQERRALILAKIVELSRELKRPLAPLTDDLPLAMSGLDSLSLAFLVADLEMELETDPFGDGGLSLPITIGDLLRAYGGAT